MEGKEVKKLIKAKGFTYRSIANTIGESEMNLHYMLSAADVKSGTLERIASAMGEDVSYFYGKQPIYSLEDYAALAEQRREIACLHDLLNTKDSLIESLRNQLALVKNGK